MSVLRMTKDVLVVLKDVMIDEFESHPVDTVPWTNASVYLGAMLFFGVDPLKAAVTAGVVALAIMYNCGRRTLIRGGVAVLFLPWRYGAGLSQTRLIGRRLSIPWLPSCGNEDGPSSHLNEAPARVKIGH